MNQQIQTFRHTDRVNGEVSDFRATITDQNERKIYLRLVDPFGVHWKPGHEVIFCRKHDSLAYADGSRIW